MASTALLFFVVFVLLCGGSVFVNPLYGIIGYVLHYHIGPEQQWWGQQVPIINNLGVGYSFLLALCIIAGTVIHWKKLENQNPLLNRHEKLYILFVLVVWLSTIVGAMDRSTVFVSVDPPEIKMIKQLLILLLMTHVVTTVKKFDIFLWIFIIGNLYVAYVANTASFSAFHGGRLDAIGGADFKESNRLAAHFAASLPLVAVQFVRSGWKGRVLAFITSGVAVNGVVLTKSRGGFLALAMCGLAAVIFSPKKIRKTVIVFLIIGGLGAFFLMDKSFLDRSSTITSGVEERDVSAQSRLDIWAASVPMFLNHPLGVGAGNFQESIIPYHGKKKDAHNMYVLCYSELGIQGIIVFGCLIFSAVLVFFEIKKEIEELPEDLQDDFNWLRFAVFLSFVATLTSGITIGKLYAENTSWFIVALPVCLLRAVQFEKYRVDSGVDS